MVANLLLREETLNLLKRKRLRSSISCCSTIEMTCFVYMMLQSQLCKITFEFKKDKKGFRNHYIIYIDSAGLGVRSLVQIPRQGKIRTKHAKDKIQQSSVRQDKNRKKANLHISIIKVLLLILIDDYRFDKSSK